MQNITAQELRQLAESADGQRGRPLKLVIRGGKALLVDANDQTPGDQPTGLGLATPAVRTAEAKRLEKVLIQKPGQASPHALPGDMDAIFWNESAVDKFLVPYYARLLSSADLDKLRAANVHPAVYAIAHCCRSVGYSISDAVDAIRIVTDSNDADVNAAPNFTSLREWQP